MNDTKENKDLYRIVYATTFKKELKKYKNQPIKLSKIIEIINNKYFFTFSLKIYGKRNPLDEAVQSDKKQIS